MMVFLCEIQEGAGDCRIVRDELMVEVGKAKEGLYILNFGGGWPGSYICHRV